MCRNIKTLFNFVPPATVTEILAATTQFVRKVSGFSKPSKVNESAFEQATIDNAYAVTELLRSMKSNAKPKDREGERTKAKHRTARHVYL